MSYSSIVEMAESESLRSRITAAAAVEGVDNPTQWIFSAIWQLAASPGWADQWDYAKATYQVNANPDLGARNDVISDTNILAAVQASQQ